MTKNATDLILRDRLQFTLTAAGDQATVYGRFDLSDYTSALGRKGLSIKEVTFMLRDPNNTVCPNTGNFPPWGFPSDSGDEVLSNASCLKVWATTRAYESASDVGIASPDVLVVETWNTLVGPFNVLNGVSQPGNHTLDHNRYSAGDLHPDGFPVVTDLLIGIAADNWLIAGGAVIELDVMIIAEPITITQKQLTEMLVQGQDQ
tara:strand:+ start:374 stop:985 length:612 start_codon:yes stop_codon:yes gene_type:complete